MRLPVRAIRSAEGSRVVTHEGDGEERQAPDETMQLKLPAGFRPDETMQLRLSDLEIPEAPEIPEGETKPVRHRGRKAHRASLRSRLSRLAAALGPRFAPVIARLVPVVTFLTPYVRKLRPVYPRPGRTDWRRWIPSWRQWLGVPSPP